MPRRAGVRAGGPDPPATYGTSDAFGAHQPSNLVPADRVAGPDRALPQLPGPVDPIVVLPQVPQDRPKAGITARTGGYRPGLERVIGARSHLQISVAERSADGLDSECRALDDVMSIGVDEGR